MPLGYLHRRAATVYIACLCNMQHKQILNTYIAETFRAVLKLQYGVYNSQLLLLVLINIAIAALQYGAIQQYHVSCPAIQYETTFHITKHEWIYVYCS